MFQPVIVRQPNGKRLLLTPAFVAEETDAGVILNGKIKIMETFDELANAVSAQPQVLDDDEMVKRAAVSDSTPVEVLAPIPLTTPSVQTQIVQAALPIAVEGGIEMILDIIRRRVRGEQVEPVEVKPWRPSYQRNFPDVPQIPTVKWEV